MPVSNKIGGNTFAAKLLSGIDSVVGGGARHAAGKRE